MQPYLTMYAVVISVHSPNISQECVPTDRAVIPIQKNIYAVYTTCPQEVCKHNKINQNKLHTLDDVDYGDAASVLLLTRL